MFLIPFVNNHRSYSYEPKEDASAAAAKEIKRWKDDLENAQKLVDEIHEETLKELGL